MKKLLCTLLCLTMLFSQNTVMASDMASDIGQMDTAELTEQAPLNKEVQNETEQFLASGQSNDVYWSIDTTGCLRITGSGDWERHLNAYSYHGVGPWHNYNSMITNAIVSLTDVTDLSYLFCEAYRLTSVDFSNLDTSKVTNMSGMFEYCTALTSLDLSCLNTSNVTKMDRMFTYCLKLTSLDLSGFDTSNVEDMNTMFSDCSSLASLDLSQFNTSKVTDMNNLFYGCSKLATLDISSFNTENVKDMSNLFAYCESLEQLDLQSFDTSNVTSMNSMFYGCKKMKELDLSHLYTPNVTDLNYIFKNCSSLETLDIRNFDTSNISDMTLLFDGCTSLKTLDLTSFNTTNVTNMVSLFNGCESLTSIDLSSFDTANVTSMSSLFQNCKSLVNLDLRSFNTSNVETLYTMFCNCDSLNQIEITKDYTLINSHEENYLSQGYDQDTWEYHSNNYPIEKLSFRFHGSQKDYEQYKNTYTGQREIIYHDLTNGSCDICGFEKEVFPTSITLDKTTLELKENETETLIATIQPDNVTDSQIVWTSSDGTIVSVDTNGNITALKSGTAAITATTSNDLTATCIVTVTQIVPTSITLDKTTLELEVNGKETLKAAIIPEDAKDKTVTWSSSDPTIASVDENGNVKALKAGTATITATTTLNGLEATCTVTVKAPFKFKDVPKSAYYYKAVVWAVENKVCSGTTATTFSPNDPCTRAQVMTFLYKYSQNPAVSSTIKNPFKDVSKSSYFYNAVLWAVENKVTSGTTATTFSPNKTCTRAEVMTFLWKLAGKPTVTGTNPFKDVSSNAYYYNAVMWAVSKGITHGTTNTTFSPNDQCTRAQVMQFIYSYATK